jgi:hypothetical protein
VIPSASRKYSTLARNSISELGVVPSASSPMDP